eukprot:m.452750 g.452750  ORF g.452750 m.452750 type:complete len:217 (-) comp20391_c0_seq1:438-1088(-)
MGDMMEEYTNEYNELTDAVHKRCARIPDLSGESKKSEIAKAEKEMQDATELVEQMEMEVMNLPSSQRSAAKAKIAEYNKSLQDLGKKMRRATVALSNSQAARDDLFDFADGDDARDALLSNTQRLDRTSRRLDDGHRSALEAVEIGAGALDELGRQRETIERSRGRLRGMDADISKSQKLLRSIYNRAIRNRIITGLIIGGLILVIIIISILTVQK